MSLELAILLPWSPQQLGLQAGATRSLFPFCSSSSIVSNNLSPLRTTSYWFPPGKYIFVHGLSLSGHFLPFVDSCILFPGSISEICFVPLTGLHFEFLKLSFNVLLGFRHWNKAACSQAAGCLHQGAHAHQPPSEEILQVSCFFSEPVVQLSPFLLNCSLWCQLW